MDAGKHDQIGIGIGGPTRELQRIADHVRNILYLGLLIVMSQQDRVFLLLEPLNFGRQVERRIDVPADVAFHGIEHRKFSHRSPEWSAICFRSPKIRQ